MINLTLREIDDDLQSLIETRDICPEDQRAEIEARIEECVIREAGKVDQIGYVFSMLQNVQLQAKAEIERLRQRQQAAENNARTLETYILRILKERNGKPLKGNHTTLYARQSEALIIDDPGIVPEQWKRTTVSVDIPRDPIKRALKAGESVPGVHIEQRESLQRK